MQSIYSAPSWFRLSGTDRYVWPFACLDLSYYVINGVRVLCILYFCFLCDCCFMCLSTLEVGIVQTKFVLSWTSSLGWIFDVMLWRLVWLMGYIPRGTEMDSLYCPQCLKYRYLLLYWGSQFMEVWKFMKI